MFHRHDKKQTTSHAKPLKDLTAIMSPGQLLSDNKRQALMQKITENSGLDPSRFETIGLNLIHHFTNHCQRLPETNTSYYSLPGGLLDYALNRTEAALSLFRQLMVLDANALLTEQQQLWNYALFSAGILQGIGKLHTDYRVDLYDTNGQLLKAWCPLLESMASLGSYYCFDFEPEGEIDFRRRLNLLMAKLLMPSSGFAWIISNAEVLAVWLALLSEDTRSAGTLGAILIRANAIAIQRYFNDLLIKGAGGRGGRSNRIGTFVDTTPDSSIGKEQLIGIEFIKWLTVNLEAGLIIMNKAPLLMVPGGMIMCVELFQWFVREHPEYKNWQAAQKAFLSLGLHRVGTDGKAITRYEQSHTHEMHSGVIFADYAIALPDQMSIHNHHTGQVSTISAIELVQMTEMNQHEFNPKEHASRLPLVNHLSQSGTWQAAGEGNKIQQPGSKHRG